ncbi:MAG: NifB/NifX family molybdenum-iron cluster-binding protein [Thiobacillaceae bacterium]|nr:NifB/NifX family molybdenum-iron cluster-binding protein [Thiobacillaceae bacterium]
MKIAVASQNRKDVTGHAGKCRRFWVYEIAGRDVVGRSLLELPIDQSLHASHGADRQPLDGVNVLISTGMGSGLRHRLRQRGIEALVTIETDPDRAVAAYLAGTLPLGEPERHEGLEVGHHHGPHRHGAAIPVTLSTTFPENPNQE